MVYMNNIQDIMKQIDFDNKGSDRDNEQSRFDHFESERVRLQLVHGSWDQILNSSKE